MKKLSIITINLNNKNGLFNTIRSIAKQDFESYELIIIDGKSTDGSLTIIDLFTTKIDHFVSENDSGIYNAMNKGLKLAIGEYCLFLNSGDWLYSSHTLTEVFSKDTNADIISGGMAYYDPILDSVKWIIETPKILTAKTLLKSSLPHQSTFIRKELFNKYGIYNEHLKITSDWEFFLRVLIDHNVSYQQHKGIISYFTIGGISFQPDMKNLALQEKRKVLEIKYPRFLSDYYELFSLEEKEQKWVTSKDYEAFNFLKKIKIVNFTIFIVRCIKLIERHFVCHIK